MPRLAAIALAVSACAASPGERLDPAAIAAQLDSTVARLSQAMIAGDTAALATIYTDSAFFAETGLPTSRGAAALRAGAADMFAWGKYLASDAQFERTEVAGDQAFRFGTYRDVVQPSQQKPSAVFGRVLLTFARDGTAGWRISGIMVIRDSVVALP